MYQIHITDLTFNAKHGVYQHERHLEQEFGVSVRLDIEATNAGQSDTLGDTVNYESVRDAVQAVLEGASRYLLEKLAEDIATRLLEDRRIIRVELTMTKPEVWDNGVPGVTLVKQRG